MNKSIWRILLVDDDEEDFFITRTTLAEARQGKFTLEWASSYEIGRQKILSGSYDVVLMDYDLGSHTGIDLVRDVSAAGSTMPILLLSGRGTFEIDLAAMRAGVMDFINKSELKPVLLERSIRYAIEQKHTQQELATVNTALSAANASLAASRHEINEILESISDGFLVINRNWRLIYINRRAAHDDFVQTEEITGQKFWEVFPHLVDSPCWDFTHQVMKTRQPGFLEMKGLLQSDRWYEISAYPTSQGISVIWRDNTEKMQVKQAIERERIFLQTALDQMLSAVIIAEAPSGRMILGNRQVETIWRQSFIAANNVEGYSAYSGFFPDGAPYKADDWPLVRSLRYAEVVRNQEIKILRGDGSYGVILANSTPILDSEGKMAAAVMTFFDITERKRAELDTLFLIDLTDLINRIEDPQALLEAIAVNVAQHLDASRCIFTSVDLDQCTNLVDKGLSENFRTFESSFTHAEMGDRLVNELRLGHPIVVRSTANDPIISPALRVFFEDNDIRSFLSVPLQQGGSWKAMLTVLDSRPRNWNERQIAFLQTVAERAWAAYQTRRLVNALLDSEERTRRLAIYAQVNFHKLETVINSMSEAVLLSTGGIFTRINPAAVALHGFSSEEEMKSSADDFKRLFEAASPSGEPIAFSDWPAARAARGDTVVSFEMQMHRLDTDQHWIGLFSAIPIRDPQEEDAFILETIVDITAIRRAEQQRSELDAKLQMQHLLVEQREQERVQIARDLHDGPIQNLIGLMFSLQSIEINATDATLQQELAIARTDAQKLVSELRGVCNALRPPLLDKFGLAKAIRSHAEDLIERSPEQNVVLELDEDHDHLDDDTRLTLYRIFQESLNNVIRHASATEITICLALQPEQIILEVRDNGIGFVVPGDWLSLARQGHLGLVGIKERAEAIGATLVLTSSPGAGTRLQITLPR